MRTSAITVTVSAVAGVLTVVQYWTTVRYGFYYDDYHFVRPYTAHEVLAAFRGPWDPSGIETAYYRPLTIGLYAARFSLLGVNSSAYHVLSLILFAIAATLFAVAAMRLLDSRVAGAIGVASFVVHPGMPYSAAVWITNQMHLAEMVVVLWALLWWFAVRRQSAGWWMPLLVLQAAVFLIKEDGVMLLPAVVAVHTLRKYLVERDLPHPPIAFIAGGAATLGLLFMARGAALEAVPAHRLPTLDQARANLVRGFSGPFFLVPAKRPFQCAASWFATLLPLTAVAGWRWLPRVARFGLASGLALGALFDLPFIFIVKPEQVHLVTMSASLSLTAAAFGLLHALRPRPVCAAVWAGAVAAGLVAMGLVARDITRDFGPGGPIVRRADRIVQEWAAVPVELRDYLAAKPGGQTATFEANPALALPIVGFGLHGRETNSSGLTLRWMSAPATDIYVARATRLVTFAVRHEIGAFQEPAHVRLEADGRVLQEMTLSDGDWHPVTIALKSRNASRLGAMHHIRLKLDRAWIPSHIIPGSTDTRTLGLQVGTIATR
ncbi:MAG TPA: hypothetical protein VEL51_18815 [Vicinamibacterales bacterium]|nr:hypothetical protein [Vicinamibacterales bacterium]